MRHFVTGRSSFCFCLVEVWPWCASETRQTSQGPFSSQPSSTCLEAWPSMLGVWGRFASTCFSNIQKHSPELYSTSPNRYTIYSYIFLYISAFFVPMHQEYILQMNLYGTTTSVYTYYQHSPSINSAVINDMMPQLLRSHLAVAPWPSVTQESALQRGGGVLLLQVDQRAAWLKPRRV